MCVCLNCVSKHVREQLIPMGFFCSPTFFLFKLTILHLMSGECVVSVCECVCVCERESNWHPMNEDEWRWNWYLSIHFIISGILIYIDRMTLKSDQFHLVSFWNNELPLAAAIFELSCYKLCDLRCWCF